jgi:hypothetical protein
VLGAEEAMQAQRLGEASNLQMAQMQEAANVQAMVMKGEEGMMERDLDIRKTQLQAEMEQLSIYNSAAQTAKDQGHFGEVLGFVGNIVGSMSDARLKENICHTGYSESGIPTYNFSYINDDKTWSGTMAQDLIELGRADAVSMYGNYYIVDYNLIDVEMKEVKSSPLKQLDQGAEFVKQDLLGSAEAGMDILAKGQERKQWEETQVTINTIQPLPKKLRKMKDLILKNNQKQKLSDRGLNMGNMGIDAIPNNITFLKAVRTQLVRFQDELYMSLQSGDKYYEKEVKEKIAGTKRITNLLLEKVGDYNEDHFGLENKLSKGVSEQQLSIATQMYCENTNLRIVCAEKGDIRNGVLDYYGNIVKEDNYYGIIETFEGMYELVHILDGYKNVHIQKLGKVDEYLQFTRVFIDEAKEASKAKEGVKMPIGKAEAKIDSMFGHNDGTATKSQDILVLQFAHDDILGDAGTYKRHLYEHPNIQNLNYGGFDWDKMELKRDLGPGDTNYWYDDLDKADRLRLVDAIINPDNEHFSMSLLRSLIKEYYLGVLEDSWWKAMGYEQGKLDVMRLKRKDILIKRFAKAKAEAAKEGQENFAFDGEVYSTGVDPKEYKKLEKVQLQQAKANMPSMTDDINPNAIK